MTAFLALTEALWQEEAPMAEKERLAQICKIAELGLMTASLLHEIRQPLFAIKANAQLLQADSRGRSNPLLDQLLLSVDALENLVSRVGGFVRQGDKSLSPLNLSLPVTAALGLVDYRLRRSKVVVHRELEPHLPEVRGDASALQEIFVNLLTNALDALEGCADRHLWVVSRSVEEGGVEVLIGDNGAGVSAEDAARIFEYFYTTKPAGKGTGLGLAISADIARAHGGSLELVSVVDRAALRLPGPPPSTLFRLRLPAVSAVAVSPPSPEMPLTA